MSSTKSGGLSELSERAIKRWRLVLIGSIGIMLLATIAWAKIPRLEDPRVDISVANLRIVYPGASAGIVESHVLKVVEPGLRELDGLKTMSSWATPGEATIQLAFEEGTSMDVIVERIRGRIAARRAELPPEVRDPIVFRGTTANLPQMVVTVSGNRSDAVLLDAARLVRDDITAIPAVAGATLRGAGQRAIRVRIDPGRLAQYGLTPDLLRTQIEAGNVRVAGGELRVGQAGTLLEIDGDLSGIEQLRNLPLTGSSDARSGTRMLRLGDVADVGEALKPPTERFVHDRLPAVGIEVRFRQDANAIATGDVVRAHLKELAPRLPPHTQVRIAHDQPLAIDRSIASFLQNLGEGVVLVVLVITIGLGLRSSLVVAGVLPLAIGSAIIGLFAIGMSLDGISLAGLTVALGLLVDDAVVVAESIDVMREKGLDRVRAAVLGTSRVFWANNATTAVACASFAPLFFMGGTVGAFVRGLPAAVIFSLVASLAVAQIFTPWASLFAGKKSHGSTPTACAPAPLDDRALPAALEKNPAVRVAKRAYGAMAPLIVRHPWKIVALFAALLCASCAALPHVGVEFFPKADKAMLFVRVNAPRGTHLDATREKLKVVLAMIEKDPAVVDVSAVIGGGYPAVFASYEPAGVAPDVADVLVRVHDAKDVNDAASRLRLALSKVPGVRTQVIELYSGPPVPHPIVLRVSGDSYDELLRISDAIEHELAAIPGTINVTDTMRETVPVTRVNVDRVRAQNLGISPAAIARALRTLHGDDAVTGIEGTVERIDVLIQDVAPGEALERLEKTTIPTANGATVPLGSFATVSLDYDAAQLRHHDGRRVIEIDADLLGAAVPSRVFALLQPKIAAMKLPLGYGVAYGGAREEAEKGFRYLALAAAAALIVVSILLVWMFDSILLAVIVMALVPFALIGAVAGLLATGLPFGFMSFLGLIALIGVFVNHKIYFVDRVRELIARGYDLRTAVTQAGNDRIRPVILTALTAILGLLPLTIGGGAMWASFGWVNVFGLLVSIPLSLVLLPAMLVGVLSLLRRDRVIATAPPPSRRNVPSIVDPTVGQEITLVQRVPPAPQHSRDFSN